MHEEWNPQSDARTIDDDDDDDDRTDPDARTETDPVHASNAPRSIVIRTASEDSILRRFRSSEDAGSVV